MQQEFYKHLLDTLYDGVYFVDNTRTITYWNHGAERISGFSAAEVLGRCCADNLLMHVDESGVQLCVCGCPLSSSLEDGQTREDEVYLHHKDGHRVPVRIRIAPMRDTTGRIIGAAEIFTDSTAQREKLDVLRTLKQLSLADPLTALGNRRAATLDFEHKSKALRHFQVPFGLLFANIDGFPDMNLAFDRETGDRVLIMVAKTLTSALRGVDKLSRWEGEEFVAFVPGVDADTFHKIAERMRRLVESSALPTPEGLLRVTVSVGGSMALPTDTLDSLMVRAGAMMHLSKCAGCNRTTLDTL